MLSLLVAFAGDRMRMRGIWVMAATLVGIGGYAIYLGTADKNALYAATFLQVIGAYVSAPTLSVRLRPPASLTLRRPGSATTSAPATSARPAWRSPSP